MSTERPYKVVDDPLYVVMAAFFALLTTALPAFMGQPRFMLLLQSAALLGFMAIALRQRNMPQTLLIMAVWVVVQLITLTIMSALFMAQIEQTIPGGFELRTGLIEWVYVGTPPPGSLLVNPVGRLLEIAGIMAGSLLTGGLLGVWFLMRTVNQVGFSIGVLLTGLEDVLFLIALPPWALLRIGGYASLVALLAEPLWSKNWSPSYYVNNHRALFLTAIGLLLASLILEALLSGVWPSLFR